MAIVEDLLFPLTLFTVLGCGLMAGLFFAFSVSVMKALARLSPAEGLAAMQSINVAILNPLFLTVFFGTAAGCALVIIASLLRWRPPGSVYLLVGGALYLLGSFLVTMIFNVPLNDALAAVAPADPGGTKLWADYLSTWTAWNHVRAAASLAPLDLLGFQAREVADLPVVEPLRHQALRGLDVGQQILGAQPVELDADHVALRNRDAGDERGHGFEFVDSRGQKAPPAADDAKPVCWRISGSMTPRAPMSSISSRDGSMASPGGRISLSGIAGSYRCSICSSLSSPSSRN